MKHWTESYGTVGALDASEELERAGLIVKFTSGTITPAEKERLKALLNQQLADSVNVMIQNKGAIKADDRNIWIPIGGLPVPIPISLVAELAADGSTAAKGVMQLYKEVGPVKGIGAAARLIGWAGEHPYLTLGIAGTVIGAIMVGPALLQVAPLLLMKRRV